LIGNYNVSFFANDTSNNINNTERTNFTVRDVTPPVVFDLRPINGSVFNTSNIITISANVTDDVVVSFVRANITFPNSTTQLLTLIRDGATDKFNNTFTAPDLLGLYNVSFFANDTSNNINNTERTNFTVVDRTNPVVFELRPVAGSTFGTGTTIEVGANITDNIAVDKAFANITFPNSTTQLLTLTNVTATRFNTSFIIPNLVGRFNITFIANDTSNNINNTEKTFFFTNDTQPPAVFDVRPTAGSAFNVSDVIEIAANVTDNGFIDEVIANITLPNSSVQQVTLTLATGDKFNTSFVIPNLKGLYNVTFIANDTNNNVNNTIRTNFTVEDTKKPLVFDLFPLAGSFFNVSTIIQIAANATDNAAIDTVRANITFPNGTTQLLTLVNISQTRFNTSFSIPNLLGRFNISFIANDTSNNFNDTERTFFIAVEAVTPAVFDLRPINSSVFNTSDVIEVAANVTDNINVSIVRANITLPNSSSQILTLNRFGTSDKFNNSFTAPDLLGLYNITFIANDTSNNINNTEKTNFAVQDRKNPAVFDVRPVNNSVFNVSDIITISANVTDNIVVGIVRSNITFPNSTTQLITLIKDGATNKYNNTFIAPALLGNYNVSFFANDTSNNINNTERTNFTVRDVVAPNITVDGCRPNPANISQAVLCKANITDDVGVSVVQANITLPNGTIQQQVVVGSTPTFNFTFATTVLPGRYNVTWIANDTTNNVRTALDFFNVTDVVAPVIVLNAPPNGFNSSNVSVVFNFTATDDVLQPLNCSLFVDSSLIRSNASIQNGSPTIFTEGGFSEASHAWNVTCRDSSSNANISETRTFRLDATSPVFNSLNTTPSTEDDLDPGINITVTANVTDNLVGVHTVVLQRKLSNESAFIDLVMVRVGTDLFNATFNATDPGVYNLRLFANDTVNNNATSNIVNITVEFDRTWLRSPSSFSPVNANLSQNVTLGNLLINNTGDFDLTFNITSNSAQTRFNESANFTLTPKTIKTIQVNDTATVTGVKTVTLNISAAPNATPESRITTGSIVVAPGLPVLVVSFLTPSTDTLTVTQGQTNVEFHAFVNNTGEGNATNVTLNITIPSSWTITFGTPHKFVGNLLSGETDENTIQVTIPSNETLGVVNVLANATGFNASGVDLATLNLLFADSVSVNVTSPPPSLVPTGGGGEPAPSTATSGGGGGAVAKLPLGETLLTFDVIPALRGALEGTPVFLTNFYENAVLENMQFEVEGLLSQYVKITPIIDPGKLVYVDTRTAELTQVGQVVTFSFADIGEHTVTVNQITGNSVVVTIASEPIQVALTIGKTENLDLDGDGKADVAAHLRDILNGVADLRIYRLGPPDPDKIYFLEDRRYDFGLFAPSYLTTGDINLTVRITADIVATDPAKAGFERKQLVETRTITFRILGTPPSQVFAAIDEAKLSITRLSEAGFPTVRMSELLAKAEQEAKEQQYELALKSAQEVVALANTAFEADKLIKEIEEGIVKAKEQLLKTTETEKALALTKKAFEREDYAAALQRAKETQLTLFLETRGRVNILWFIREYWWALLIGSVALYIVMLFVYKRTMVMLIGRRLKDLIKEEQTIDYLIKATQNRHFKRKELSDDEYHKIMAQNEKRLDEIMKLKIRLHNRRVSLLKTEQALVDIKKEEADIAAAMKATQEKYFEKKELTRERFAQVYETEKKRLAELEKEETTFAETAAQRQGTGRYSLLKMLWERFAKKQKSHTIKKRLKKGRYK